jgi:hypothetical protein
MVGSGLPHAGDLTHIMAGRGDAVHLKIATIIFTIGAVAAETFESLNFWRIASPPPLPMLPT